jgi:hypothetical protein
MKKKNYNINFENATSEVREPAISYGRSNDDKSYIDLAEIDETENYPFIGPNTIEEGIENIRKAEAEYAETGIAYNAFEMLEEFKKEFGW